ncbi:MAG: AmmeMemoRadiSam system protein B [bacterium]|nr:AmmeMemoRadiSam system protein B [bacterium]
MPLPAIRSLDASPIEHEGEQYICLRDPEGIVEDPAVLSPVGFFVATCLDGVNDVLDIQYHFINQSGGRVISEEEIRKVVAFLDEHAYLQNDTFEAKARAIAEAFASAPARPAHLAGKSYPDNADELRDYLDGLLAEADGGGEAPEGPVRCLIAPHIDFDRGGPGYAHAYARLAAGPAPEVAIVFGVIHAGAAPPFVLTRKDFATPLGTVTTDVDLVNRLAEACPWDAFEAELAHRTEHSLEFQAVMLAHMFGDKTRIVPVLCGVFCDEDDESPADLPGVTAFLDVCRSIMSESGGKAVVIAGADLAHVGHRFGDEFDIDDAIVARVRERDTEDLAYAAKGDHAGWYWSVMKDGNERRVCGINCVYSALRSVDGTAKAGEVLHYGYAPDPAGGIVSFAAVALG